MFQSFLTLSSAPLLEPSNFRYPGFKSVQLFPARASRSPPEAYSFIEFDSPDQASVAKEALDQFKLTPEKSLFVHWAKRGD